MNGDDYAQGATARDAEYRKAYKAWVEGLDPDDRRELEASGLLAADLGMALGVAAASGSRERDAAESSEAAVEVDMAALFDTLPEFLREKRGLSGEQAAIVSEWHQSTVEKHSLSYKAWLLNKLIAGLLMHANVKLAAGALAFATNLSALNGMGTMTAWARGARVGRAAVSKTTKWWQRELKLPRSVHMKTDFACARYAAAGQSNHWRKRIYDANQRAGGVRDRPGRSRVDDRLARPGSAGTQAGGSS